jgi:hypothetical protein
MIQINFKLTEKEIYKSLVDTANSRLITKVLRWSGFALMGLMLFYIANQMANATFEWSMTTVFPLLLGGYLFFLPEITGKMQAPNLIKTKNPFSEPVRVKMDHDGFRITGNSFNVKIEWNQFREVIETKDFYLLKATEGTANVLPKRAFADADHAAFLSLVRRANIPKIKLLPGV